MRYLLLFSALTASLLSITPIVHAENINKVTLKAKYNLSEGKVIYAKTCSGCHATGVLSAPKVSDAAAWKPLMTKGMATLIKHTVDGYNAMPANGGLEKLTFKEASNTVAYMVEQSLL